MNILIVSFETCGNFGYHLGVDLELAEKHLRQGDAVTFLGCDGSIGACQTNKRGFQVNCTDCKLRRLDATRELSGAVAIHSLKAPHIKRQLMALPGPLDSHTVSDYEAFKYAGHDLGLAAVSSALNIHRDPRCESEEAMLSIELFLRAACSSYEATRHFLSENKNYDCAYIFSGRFAAQRGALRAIQDAHIPCFTHERGNSFPYYDTYPDALPQDLALRQKRTIEAWENSNNHEKRDKWAHQFYQEHRSGRAVAWKNYVNDQLPGSLPENWDEKKHNIVIFNSSQDEMASISEYNINTVYASQAEALTKITEDSLLSKKPIHFYLRIHPNLAKVTNSDMDELLSIRSPNLTIIGGGDTISTYALLDACDCVLTFGSTMGAEATYWGKPSVLVSPSFYDELDVAYQPTSHEEVVRLLLRDDLPPKPRLGALKYGYYRRTWGMPLEYWKPLDLWSGHFGGLFFSPDVSWLGKRYSLHNKLYLLFSSLCRNNRSLATADKLARPLCILAYKVRNVFRRVRKFFKRDHKATLLGD